LAKGKDDAAVNEEAGSQGLSLPEMLLILTTGRRTASPHPNLTLRIFSDSKSRSTAKQGFEYKYRTVVELC
jgi:hypothetical protein